MPVREIKLPAPTGGWNTRDPISQMDPLDAISLTNFIPDVEGLTIRPGYTQYVELVSSSNQHVQALIPWKTQYGQRLIAGVMENASSGSIYDITTSTKSQTKTGYVGAKWRHAVLNARLGLVNGVDQPQELTFTPGSGVVIKDMSISGGSPTAENFKYIHVFKSRSYFASGDEPAFWYSEVNALGGTLTKFPIDRVAKTSGNVIGINSWTRDGGSGPDDFFVAFLDTGEIIVYQGSNPGDASDWALVGRYTLGKVLATFEFAGKIQAVTDKDYNLLPDDLLAEGLKLPSKLSGAARDAVAKDQTDNWQILVDPIRGWRIVNVPAGSKREQHVLNLRTGSATRLDYPANVWAVYNNNLYFGGTDATVYKVESGKDDNGTAIEFACQQAFSDGGIPTNKWIRNYRPMWTIEGDISYSSGLAFDFGSRDFVQSITITETDPQWDTSSWDTTSWGVGNPARSEWLSGAGIGQNVSLFMNGSATRKGTWHYTDFRIETARSML